MLYGTPAATLVVTDDSTMQGCLCTDDGVHWNHTIAGSMARCGFSPATRVFEAAGAKACIISDNWQGIETFFEPGKEILSANDGADVAAYLAEVGPEQARTIGEAAYKRALAQHTYERRARQLCRILDERMQYA